MTGGSEKTEGVEQGPPLGLSLHAICQPWEAFRLTDSPETIGLVRTHQGRLVSGSELNLQAR